MSHSKTSVSQDPSEQELHRLRLENQRLVAENASLRKAADAFGELAERLNLELREERRRGDADRRSAPRVDPSGQPAGQRRASGASAR